MKLIHCFGTGTPTDGVETRDLLGSKGHHLAEMAMLGIPVPPGFTITTEVCAYYQDHAGQTPKGLEAEVEEHLKKLEKAAGKKFGDAKDPLLVSVRSGAAASMPGMMDTILNLGLNDETAHGLAAASGNERFAYDSYGRLVRAFGVGVMGVTSRYETDGDPFDVILDELKKEKKAKLDTDLSAEDLETLVERFKAAIQKKTGKAFPQDPKEQLWGAIFAVFRSWNNPRAVKYRELYEIKGLLGTAANVQAMVFGNMGDGCGTGVAFTRNPATGENLFYGEYLMNAQGEDVVAGIRTPHSISELEKEMPDCYRELLAIREKLESHYKDMQDIEFTIERGKVYMLGSRTGMRTEAAAVRIAVEMVDEGLIDEKQAVLRVSPGHMERLLQPVFDPRHERSAAVLTRGLPASPGVASGAVALSAEDALTMAAQGRRVILVRVEISPQDIGGVDAAQGILTVRGGMTSHAAVIARGMGKCCVAGASALVIHYARGCFTAGRATVSAGDWISLNGATGAVYLGEIPTTEGRIEGDAARILDWADRFRRLAVRANADTAGDARRAVASGAQGIGLCRVEFMLLGTQRMIALRSVLLQGEEAERRAALSELLASLRHDFEEIFVAVEGCPVGIRLLDFPLNELLPANPAEEDTLAAAMNLPSAEASTRIAALRETNPMVGHRGCRLGITHPDITEMQVRAAIEAACNVHRKGVRVSPEIVVPFVGSAREFTLQRDIAVRVIQEVLAAKGLSSRDIPWTIGSMIELPRAVLTADEIAAEASFFVLDTSHLTQTVCGFSHDDSAPFLVKYIAQGVYTADPFRVIDERGVGKAIAIACRLGRRSRPDLVLGAYGGHCDDPASIAYLHATGLDYVSCSPYMVPSIRLAAAHAALGRAE